MNAKRSFMKLMTDNEFKLIHEESIVRPKIEIQFFERTLLPSLSLISYCYIGKNNYVTLGIGYFDNGVASFLQEFEEYLLGHTASSKEKVVDLYKRFAYNYDFATAHVGNREEFECQAQLDWFMRKLSAISANDVEKIKGTISQFRVSEIPEYNSPVNFAIYCLVYNHLKGVESSDAMLGNIIDELRSRGFDNQSTLKTFNDFYTYVEVKGLSIPRIGNIGTR